VGKFLATQSDDKSVIVWRTEDWQPVKRVAGYFDKCFGNSFALRCGFSPDGQVREQTDTRADASPERAWVRVRVRVRVWASLRANPNPNPDLTSSNDGYFTTG